MALHTTCCCSVRGRGREALVGKHISHATRREGPNPTYQDKGAASLAAASDNAGTNESQNGANTTRNVAKEEQAQVDGLKYTVPNGKVICVQIGLCTDTRHISVSRGDFVLCNFCREVILARTSAVHNAGAVRVVLCVCVCWCNKTKDGGREGAV